MFKERPNRPKTGASKPIFFNEGIWAVMMEARDVKSSSKRLFVINSKTDKITDGGGRVVYIEWPKKSTYKDFLEWPNRPKTGNIRSP